MGSWLRIELERQTFFKERETINLDDETNCVNPRVIYCHLYYNYYDIITVMIEVQKLSSRNSKFMNYQKSTNDLELPTPNHQELPGE